MTDTEHLIILYLQDKLPPEARQKFELWKNESEDNQRMVDDFRQIWKLTAHKEVIDFESDLEWKKLASNLLPDDKVPVHRLNATPNYWLKIAASLTLILLTSGILYITVFKSGEVSHQTSDTRGYLTLPDGSEVWLNMESRLTYKDNFDDNRFVELEGEGFFNIKKDPSRPFVIKTNEAHVKVLGTSFNVRSYSHETRTEVYVVTGLVGLVTNDLSDEIRLTPGVTGVLNKNDQSLVAEVQQNLNILAWKNRQLVFKQTPLRKVVKVLETYFQRDIEVININLLDCRFTGSFQDPSMEEVVESVGLALDLKVNVREGIYVLDGIGCEAN